MEKSKKISVAEVKRELKSYDKDQLITMLMDCYKLSSDVKNYVNVLLYPEQVVDELYNKALHQITEQFFPKRGYGKLKLAEAKRAISEFKKWSGDEFKTIDLMLCYVELCVEFTNTYEDIGEAFYSSLVSVYANVCEKVNGNLGWTNAYRERLERILKDTNRIGWGVHDALIEVYMSYFDIELEDL